MPFEFDGSGIRARWIRCLVIIAALFGKSLSRVFDQMPSAAMIPAKPPSDKSVSSTPVFNSMPGWACATCSKARCKSARWATRYGKPKRRSKFWPRVSRCKILPDLPSRMWISGGAKVVGSIASQAPNCWSARAALGPSCKPAPNGSNREAFSNTKAECPALATAKALAKPAIPPPIILILRLVILSPCHEIRTYSRA